MKINHMDYLIPFNSELNVPYRAPKKIKDMVRYIFSHPYVPAKQRKLFLDVSTSGSRYLINDMSCVAISIVRHYIEHPNQYGGSVDNIHLQLLSRMWKQTFNHMWKQNKYPRKEIELGEWNYLGVKYKMLSIENGLIEELIRVVLEEDFHQTSSTVKGNQSSTKPVEEPLLEGSDYFEYLANLE